MRSPKLPTSAKALEAFECEPKHTKMKKKEEGKKSMLQAIGVVGWYASKKGDLVFMTASELRKGIKATGIGFDISNLLVSRALRVLGFKSAFNKGRWGYMVHIATEGVKKVNGPG